MLKISTIITFCLLPIVAYSQFSGKVLDSETNRPISNVTITTEDGKGVTTLQNGTFEINLDDFPVVIRLSHVSYRSSEILIQSPVQSGLTIYLEPKVFDIEEIEVIGERIKRYIQDKYFYIVDYDFLDKNICLIGYENKNLSKGSLLFVNSTEDTLAYYPVQKPRKLYRDAFNNIHLITKDSIYQLYYDSSTLLLLYPSALEDVPMDFFNLKFVNQNKFLFKKISPTEQSHQYYVVDTVNKTNEILTNIVNYQLTPSRGTGVEYGGAIKGIPNRANLTTLAQIQQARRVFEMVVYDISIIHFPVHSYVFRYKSGFIITDLINKQILHYNDQFEFTEEVKARLPKHNQRQKVMIQDPFTEKIYWVHYKGSRVLLGEINPHTGQIIETLETPSFPFIENIKIRNGVIWFTYQPRLGETVRSLYRMNN